MSMTVKFFSDDTPHWYEAKELNFGSLKQTYILKKKSIAVFRTSAKKKKKAFCQFWKTASLIPFSSLKNQQVAIASSSHTLSNTRTKKKVENTWSFNSEFFLLKHEGSLCLTVAWKIWLIIKNTDCQDTVTTDSTEAKSLRHYQKVVWTDKHYWMHSSITYLIEALVQVRRQLLNSQTPKSTAR